MDENRNEKTTDDTLERPARPSVRMPAFGLPARRPLPTGANETLASTALSVVCPTSSIAEPGAITESDLRRLKQIAAEVRSCETRVLAQARRIGARLLEARNILKADRKFCSWIEENCHITARTARNYMSLAQHFHGPVWETVSYMDARTAYALAAPSSVEVRARFVAAVEEGRTMTASDVKTELARERAMRQSASDEAAPDAGATVPARIDKPQEAWTDLIDYLTRLVSEDPTALIVKVRGAGLTDLADALGERATAP